MPRLTPSQEGPVSIRCTTKRQCGWTSTGRKPWTDWAAPCRSGCSRSSCRKKANRGNGSPVCSRTFSPLRRRTRFPVRTSVPQAMGWLTETVLTPFLAEIRSERSAEVERVAEHVELSLTEVLHRIDLEIGRAGEEAEKRSPGAEGRLAQAEARHADALARRDRRREELERERAVTLQGVERLASALILPHPEREAPELKRLRPNPDTEMTAMRIVMEHETARGCQVYDVHEKNLGYDITSLDLSSGELRLIEVKGLAAATGTILLTPNERRVAEDRPDCYWLYVVTGCANDPTLREPISDPARFPWHEVTKVQHYWMNVEAMAKGSAKEPDSSRGSEG